MNYHGKIIDTHAHIFPEKIAAKATKNIGAFYDIPMTGMGTSEMLLEAGAKIGVRKFVVHSSATTIEQVQKINDFIHAEVERNKEHFIGLCSLHPDMSREDVAAELDRIAPYGFHGVKLHPDFQHFFIDEDRAMNLYVECEKRNLSILFHTGDARYEESKPFRLANVAKKFPRLRVIGAHFGGYSCWDEVFCYDGLDNVWFDTCSALFALSKERAVDLIRHFGADRFFFSSDFPMWQHDEELARFMALDLTEEERELILYKNAEKFYGIAPADPSIE